MKPSVADQTRVFGEELPTDGYVTGEFFASYSFKGAAGLLQYHHGPARQRDRHTLSQSPELPEGHPAGGGRSFKLVYALGF